MNIDSILKKEGIEIKSKLASNQVNKIATIIANNIYEAFPEHNLNLNSIYSNLVSLEMYVAKIPDNAVAKYFYNNSTIYFSDKMNFNNIDTLTIHECIHALQESRNSKGKLIKLGLFNLNSNKGQGINEAAVQLMASRATNISSDTVKYYNMDFSTPSPLFYPLETALMNQLIFFTGSYPLYHSTLYSDNIFKNTFIAKTNEKTYSTIEKNFDLLLHYEELLSLCVYESTDINNSVSKIKKINAKIDAVKNMIRSITFSTQNLIIEQCFNSEFDLIKDKESLEEFKQRLKLFENYIINTDSYDFYSHFCAEILNKLKEKETLIEKHGILTYLNDLQTDLLDLERETFGFKFFHRLFDKLKLLFEEALRDKNIN